MRLRNVSNDIDTSSFDIQQLIDTHHIGVWRLLRALGADADTADDLTQETFLAVYRDPFEVRSERESVAYLRRVAKNLFISWCRKHKRLTSEAEVDAIAEAAENEPFAGTGDDHQLALEQCISRLKGRSRELIELRYREGRELAEAAEIMGLKPGHVSVLLHRVHQALRACVEQRLKRDD